MEKKLSEDKSKTIMKYAVDHSSLKCVRVFLDMGIKISESKDSLMKKAKEKGDTSFLEYLMENDPKILFLVFYGFKSQSLRDSKLWTASKKPNENY